MKTKTLLLLVLAGTSLAAACEKTVECVPVTEQSPSREITFGLSGASHPDLVTKATTQVDADNLGTLYVSALTGSDYAFQNVAFTQGTDGKWRGGKYWPASNPAYRFAASNVNMTESGSHPSVTVADADTDVVVAYLADPSFQADNVLQLQHIFAQIGTVTMKAPAGYTVTDLKLRLRPIRQGTYYLDTNDWTAGEAVADDVYILGTASGGIDLEEGGSYTSEDNDLWLVPGNYSLTATYTISKDDYTQSKTATATVNFTQGYNNHIGLNDGASNIPVPDDIHEISFTVTVTPWSEQYVTASFTENNS